MCPLKHVDVKRIGPSENENYVWIVYMVNIHLSPYIHANLWPEIYTQGDFSIHDLFVAVVSGFTGYNHGLDKSEVSETRVGRHLGLSLSFFDSAGDQNYYLIDACMCVIICFSSNMSISMCSAAAQVDAETLICCRTNLNQDEGKGHSNGADSCVIAGHEQMFKVLSNIFLLFSE